MEEYLEEYVRQSREEKRLLFGSVGVKDDCENYETHFDKPSCKVCGEIPDQYGRKNILPCKKGVCYFYEPGTKKGKV
jgi:hypothetical protein